jgi:hypothetical protein
MKKDTFGCNHKLSWTFMRIIFINAPSRRFYFSGRIHHQKMPPRSWIPFYNNCPFLKLEDKDFFQGGDHVRNITSITSHVGRIICLLCNKGQN